ncbi:hypothetical protein SPRG_10761 [Saprolegnia parasitica CBS 223.65]|uniref:Uncharacterized protein n=1 Tax=Saprolegnia parasitica (strain CBS 223.65) TaxID=695850 RepID=A0A067CAJ3_SAPPC|nr:hypothetical protein SPRG_10761 [Saprolegnia parasitica CBS 223.65]KDO23566.1 hypothetical protein SPRG_10761 [Saprolegnia parasitica CBS 223.65]|eukprot:XP_012205716.1 hypothetical protein SPRG_10761 [Saprolegnia parasitica CBS 223.65]
MSVWQVDLPTLDRVAVPKCSIETPSARQQTQRRSRHKLRGSATEVRQEFELLSLEADRLRAAYTETQKAKTQRALWTKKLLKQSIRANSRRIDDLLRDVRFLVTTTLPRTVASNVPTWRNAALSQDPPLRRAGAAWMMDFLYDAVDKALDAACFPVSRKPWLASTTEALGVSYRARIVKQHILRAHPSTIIEAYKRLPMLSVMEVQTVLFKEPHPTVYYSSVQLGNGSCYSYVTQFRCEEHRWLLLTQAIEDDPTVTIGPLTYSWSSWIVGTPLSECETLVQEGCDFTGSRRDGELLPLQETSRLVRSLHERNEPEHVWIDKLAVAQTRQFQANHAHDIARVSCLITDIEAEAILAATREDE